MRLPDRVCGCMGCRDRAVVVVNLEKYGQRAVCEEHATGQAVIADV